jgi:hypothetical protein
VPVKERTRMSVVTAAPSPERTRLAGRVHRAP